MTDQDLIAAFLAKGGEVVKCPPRTYAIDPSKPYSWRRGSDASWKARQAGLIVAERRREATAAMVAEIPVGQIVTKPINAKKPKQVAPKRDLSLPRAKRTEAGNVPLSQIKEMIAGGMTAGQVADKLGCPKNTIASRLFKAGVRISDLRAKAPVASPVRKEYSDDQIRAAIATRTHMEAAAFLGMHERNLRKRWKALGIRPLSGLRPATDPVALAGPIIAMIEQGLSMREAGAKLGIATATVSSRLERAGLTVKGIVRDMHIRKYGHARNMGSVKARGNNKPKPFCAGGYEWPDRRTASVELQVHYKSLADWTHPDAKPRMRAKLAAAIEAWERQHERTAA